MCTSLDGPFVYFRSLIPKPWLCYTYSLWKNKIGSKGGVAIGQALATNRVLQRLQYVSVRLCSACVLDATLINETPLIFAAITCFYSIQLLLIRLSDNNIGPDGAQAFGSALLTNPRLLVLK